MEGLSWYFLKATTAHPKCVKENNKFFLPVVAIVSTVLDAVQFLIYFYRYTAHHQKVLQ